MSSSAMDIDEGGEADAAYAAPHEEQPVQEDLDTSKGKEHATPQKRFEIKKFNAVALWAWDIVVDNCAICRNHIMDLCIECQANQAAAST